MSHKVNWVKAVSTLVLIGFILVFVVIASQAKGIERTTSNGCHDLRPVGTVKVWKTH